MDGLDRKLDITEGRKVDLKTGNKNYPNKGTEEKKDLKIDKVSVICKTKSRGLIFV